MGRYVGGQPPKGALIFASESRLSAVPVCAIQSAARTQEARVRVRNGHRQVTLTELAERFFGLGRRGPPFSAERLRLSRSHDTLHVVGAAPLRDDVPIERSDGCGGVIVYVQEPATLSNGDDRQSSEHNGTSVEMDPRSITKRKAMKITTLPR